jgi:hypothetical protein
MNTELYETKVDKVLGKGLRMNLQMLKNEASRNCYKCRGKRSKIGYKRIIQQTILLKQTLPLGFYLRLNT